jgi:DNA primase
VAEKEPPRVLSIDGREVRITHPSKPTSRAQARLSKLDVVRYYLVGRRRRAARHPRPPIVLKRFVDGAEGEAFYQKRAPRSAAAGCAR